MTVYEWLLLTLLLLAVVLVCVAAGAFYGDRPQYPSTGTVYSARAEDTGEIRHRDARHSDEDRGMSTQRLGPYPPQLYRGREEWWKDADWEES